MVQPGFTRVPVVAAVFCGTKLVVLPISRGARLAGEDLRAVLASRRRLLENEGSAAISHKDATVRAASVLPVVFGSHEARRYLRAGFVRGPSSLCRAQQGAGFVSSGCG